MMGDGIEQTVLNGERLAADYPRIAAGIEKVRPGMAKSEVFFIYATLAEQVPRRIIESGRCKGQSTLLLGRCYPHVPIVSIEFDERAPYAAWAVERPDSMIRRGTCSAAAL